MSKIAFVSGYYSISKNTRMSESTKFMYECLFNSAKKFFLKDHDVDFIFINNNDDYIDDVTNIQIDEEISSYNKMLLMKILCVEYLENKYDYIFVSDGDQIFVNDVVGSDLLTHDFNILDHFFKPKTKDILNILTDDVLIDGDIENSCWTMGNFFGGKRTEFMELLRKTKEYHNNYLHIVNPKFGFYAKFPDEVFLIKYMLEENKNFNRLNTLMVPTNSEFKFFLSDFQKNEDFYPNFNSSKLLHDTKKNLDTLKKIIKYYS